MAFLALLLLNKESYYSQTHVCIQCVWGFTTAADRQRLESFLRRARRSGLYHTDRPTVAQLAEDADDTLFSSVTRSSNHLLHVLLPNIPIIHITLGQGPIVSNSLPSMIIVILLTECYLDRPTRYLCDC